MKVAIVSGARATQPMGIGLVEQRLLAALRADSGGVSIDVRVVGGRAGRRYAPVIGARWYPVAPGRVPRHVWRSADLIHLLGLDVPPPRRGLFVVSMYDVASMRYADESPFPSWTADLLARAERVITSSQSGARDIEAMFSVSAGKFRVIPLGPGQTVTTELQPLSESELAGLNLRSPFVLRMGGYTQRKNVPVLLEAWPDVYKRTGALLALVGPPHGREARLAAATSLDGVVALDYLSSALVTRLMRSSAALVSPSTYEGFGLPPLEAMAAGTPVVAVRSASVEEVCGPAALLVENDAAMLAEGVVRVLTDERLRGRLIEAGRRRAEAFSWDATASSVTAVYRELDFTPRRAAARP